MKTYTLLALGPATPATDAAWLESPSIGTIFRHRRAAANGKRFGSRVFGIGVDSLVLALRTLNPSVKGPYLANNPWIGAALRVTGRSDFVVTGIYAEPSSRSWQVLRKLIGSAPVIALSESETKPWNAAGGRAQAILYGNSFGYPERDESRHLHIFVGGTSDRDPQVIEALKAEVLASVEPVRLTVATGELAGEISNGANVISRPGYLNQQEFGALLSTSTVAFLPIREGTRAAGHMVLVGALECGIPVAITSSEGMKEYPVNLAVQELDMSLDLIPQLRGLSNAMLDEGHSIRRVWSDRFSLAAYVKRIGRVLETL